MKIAPRGRADRNLAEHGVDMKMVMGNRACRNIYRETMGRAFGGLGLVLKS